MEKNCTSRSNRVIVFDSGIGGLNLLYECACRVPDMEYFYISDNANVPYGNKNPREILSLTLNALQGIDKLNPCALVVACNTVTAQCIGHLREMFSFPVIGIQPAVKQAAEAGGECLVLATKSTVESRAFHSLVDRFPDARCEIVACENLAEYIETNILCLPQKLPECLLPRRKVDCVVLGCTHYSFVKEQIESVYGCPVFDGIAGTAAHFEKIVGITDHQRPRLGKNDHGRDKRLNITFLRGDCEKNSQIFKSLFSLK